MTRRVIVSKIIWLPEGGQTAAPKGEAVFHGFGVRYEKLNDAVGMTTSAIVEWPDGKLENLPLWLIQFIDPIATDTK